MPGSVQDVIRTKVIRRNYQETKGLRVYLR